MFEPFLRSALKSARSIVVIISTTHHSQFEIRPISKDLKVALEQRSSNYTVFHGRNDRSFPSTANRGRPSRPFLLVQAASYLRVTAPGLRALQPLGRTPRLRLLSLCRRDWAEITRVR